MSHGMNAPFLFGEVQIKDTLIALFIAARDLCILASITNFPGAKSIWKFLTPKKESHCLNGSPAWKRIVRHTVPTIWTTRVILKFATTWEVKSKNLLKCQWKLNWDVSSTLMVKPIWMPIIPVHRKSACEGLTEKVSGPQAAECLTLGTAEERKSETAWLQIWAEWALG